MTKLFASARRAARKAGIETQRFIQFLALAVGETFDGINARQLGVSARRIRLQVQNFIKVLLRLPRSPVLKGELATLEKRLGVFGVSL